MSEPWLDEPDEKLFEHMGYPCIIWRAPLGHWCGYVGVPKTHPYYEITEPASLSVHGGVTFCDSSHSKIPQMNPDFWWIGFDCGHFGDYVPLLGLMRWEVGLEGVYRDIEYVTKEVTCLAEQLYELASSEFRLKP